MLFYFVIFYRNIQMNLKMHDIIRYFNTNFWKSTIFLFIEMFLLNHTMVSRIADWVGLVFN